MEGKYLGFKKCHVCENKIIITQTGKFKQHFLPFNGDHLPLCPGSFRQSYPPYEQKNIKGRPITAPSNNILPMFPAIRLSDEHLPNGIGVPNEPND